MRIQTALPIIAIALFGCKGGGGSAYVPKPVEKITPASVKPGEEASLFPLAVGNEWTFVVEAAGADLRTRRTMSGEVKLRVVDVQQEGDGKRATIEMLTNDKVNERQVWVVNSKGIFQIGKGAKEIQMYSTPQPVVIFPVEVGKTFSWKGLEGKVQRDYVSKVIGPQEVDTEEKRLSGIAIESKGNNKAGTTTEKTEGTIWLAPGIGIVRYIEMTVGKDAIVRNVLKLKSHTLK